MTPSGWTRGRLRTTAASLSHICIGRFGCHEPASGFVDEIDLPRPAYGRAKKPLRLSDTSLGGH